MSRQNKKGMFPPLAAKAITRFNMWLIELGSWFQRKTNQYSSGQKKLFLLVFCLTSVSVSFILILSGFKTIGEHREVKQFNYGPSWTKRWNSTLKSRGEESVRIEKFIDYLDHHKAFRDRMLISRPGLLDTLKYLNHLYKPNQYGK